MRKKRTYKKRRTPTKTKIVYRTQKLGKSLSRKTPTKRRRYSWPTVPVRAYKAPRMRRVNGSIFGQSFNAKNYIVKTAIGVAGGIGIKMGLDYVYEKTNITDTTTKLIANLALGIGAPLYFRKNKKVLSWLLPASFAFTTATATSAVTEYLESSSLLSGGVNIQPVLPRMNGGVNIMRPPVMAGPTNVSSVSGSSFENF